MAKMSINRKPTALLTSKKPKKVRFVKEAYVVFIVFSYNWDTFMDFKESILNKKRS